MTQPSGWYDDPQDSSQLRYWDGVVWSTHITPKVSPTVEQSHIGMPYGVTPAAARPPSAGSYGAQGPSGTPGGFHPPGPQGQGQGSGPQDGVQDQEGVPGQAQQGPQYAPYGQHPGSLPQGQLDWQSQSSTIATTPDGVMLSGWWKRVLARILDNIIVAILALPLTFVPLQKASDLFLDYFEKAFAAGAAGGTTVPPAPTAELEGPLLQISLTVLAVHLVYEIALLTMTGATLGKRMVGISVRLTERPGPPPLAAVLKRTAVKEVGRIVGSLPAVGFLGSVFGLLDYLWPLWDKKKQALHDKVAATNVVVGSQPRRDS